MGLKTPWFHMRDRFKDTFGIGSGINLESKWVLKTTWFQMWNRFKDTFGIGSGINLELKWV